MTVISVPLTETNGPDHSSKPKVVVPSKITWVPCVRSVRSRVVPLGTGMLLRTIVAHAALDLIAEAALVNVQVVALSSIFAAGVGAGAGAAATSEGKAMAKKPRNDGTEYMVITE